MITANLTSHLEDTITRFHHSRAQTRLVVLYYLAKKIHATSKKTTPSAFFSQKVHSVLQQIQQIPKEERVEALQEILQGAPTRLVEAYNELDANMRTAFWYRLANDRREGALLPSSLPSSSSYEQEQLLSDLESRDSNELVAFLREAVKAPTPTPASVNGLSQA